MDRKEFSQLLKAGKVAGAYLFEGVEENIKAATLQSLRKAILPEGFEELNESLMDAFYINKNYLMAFLAYLAAFSVIGSFVVQMYAIPLLFFISGLFLIKTYEFLVNKFCYVDAHLVLIYKAVLERVWEEMKTAEQQ